MNFSTTIIIPTRNRTADLRHCLALLIPQLPGDGSVTVLVCDDSDGPETAAMLSGEFPAVRRETGPRMGPGANRNAGARQAPDGWLIFLDDDCLPHPALVASYLAEIQDGGPAIDRVLSGPVLRCGEKKDSLLWEAPHNPEEHELPPSCNFALPRKLLLDSGGFDERFRIAFEDMELFARLRVLGVSFHFVPRAAVDHPSRPIPKPAKLALRWESRVISSFDFGATTLQILWRLPKHVALVILSRFRGRKASAENLRAGGIFFAEFLLTMVWLPAWLWKHGTSPRSPFWVEQVKQGKGPPHFGL